MDEIQRKKKKEGKTDIWGETQRTWWILRIWKYASFAERVSLKKLIKANNSYNEKQVSLLFFSKDKLQYAPSLHDTKNCLKEYLCPGDNPTFLVNYRTLKKNHQIEEQLILKGNKNYPLDNRQDSWDLNLMSTFPSLLINLSYSLRSGTNARPNILSKDGVCISPERLRISPERLQQFKKLLL